MDYGQVMPKSEPRTRLRERRLAGSREEIFEATRTVLRRDGFEKLTLELVAGELGISKQALYYYFPSRAALVAELMIEELFASSNAMHRATAVAPDGAAAIEALIRTYAEYFLPKLDLHRLMTSQAPDTMDLKASPEHLAKIRPCNDLMYGEVEAKLLADAGKRRDKRARRLAFTAHLSVMGMISMRAMTDKLQDPLIHSDAELVDELCRTFRAAAAEYARKR